jgi:flagellum-specific peptidoglycan hydrolase FlgJ
MIKKLVLFMAIAFFIACGSSHNVVRTSKSTSAPTKTVVRTIKKPVVKQSPKPIVKKTAPATKPVETKVIQVNKPTEIAVIKTEQSNTQIPITKEEPTTELGQFDPQIEILEATTRVKVTTAMVLSYIEKYKSIAKEDMQQFGIPASIILGQGILESGAGTGPLSTKANNHFGIKCHVEWTGPSVRYNDDVENECFRKYKDPSESYRDHSLFLITRAHYSSLFQLEKTDYKSWAKGLKNAGYATDPAYPTKLIAIIERYHLQKYDYEVLGNDYVASNSALPVKNTIEPSKAESNPSSTNQSHLVAKGDTLYSISRKYNVTIQDLKKRNSISNDTLSVGQSLIIN